MTALQWLGPGRNPSPLTQDRRLSTHALGFRGVAIGRGLVDRQPVTRSLHSRELPGTGCPEVIRKRHELALSDNKESKIKTNNGGPAFSRTSNSGGYGAQSGMMLRDYFAAKAMQGLIGSRHIDYELGSYDEYVVAENAYAMADAMIKARG